MSGPGSFAALGGERFVSLTTFRRTGRPVATAVWVAADGDDLVVLTPQDSGKVKRLRKSGRVELRPCSRMGAVADGAPLVAGHAEIEADDASTQRTTDLVRRKYGVEYHVTMLVERVLARGQKPRVGLRIRPA
jgi:PPOX class probable F420-dependent enzyme